MNVFANPLLLRYRCSLLRPGQFWVNGLVYGLIVGAILLLNGLLYGGCSTSPYDNPQALGAAFYVQFLILLAIQLLVIAPVNTGNALQVEQIERSYDFFRLLPLSPVDRALGILFGRNLAILPFAGLTTLLVLASGCVGGIAGSFQVQVLVALGSATAAANLAALLISQRQRLPRGQMKANQVSGSLSGVVLTSVVVICAACMFAVTQDAARSRFHFYALELPWLLVLTGLFLFIVGWGVAGVLRSFRVETGPLFTRPGAIAFLLGSLMICAGLFWSSFHDVCPQDAGSLLIGYVIVSCFPLLILLADASLSRQDYTDMLAGEPEPVTPARVWVRSNVGFWLGCFAIWAGVLVAFGATGQQGRFGVPVLLFCAVTGASFLFWAGLIELHILCAERNPKLTGLFTVLVTIQSALPLLLGGVLASKNVVVFSPFGSLSLLALDSDQAVPSSLVLVAAMLHFLLGMAVLVPLSREYRELARLSHLCHSA